MYKLLDYNSLNVGNFRLKTYLHCFLFAPSNTLGLYSWHIQYIFMEAVFIYLEKPSINNKTFSPNTGTSFRIIIPQLTMLQRSQSLL